MANLQPLSLHARIIGSIVGVATCDALGGPVQFEERDEFERVTHFRSIERFRQPAGAWSDDTSMTLCVAQSIIDTSTGRSLVQSRVDNGGDSYWVTLKRTAAKDRTPGAGMTWEKTGE